MVVYRHDRVPGHRVAGDAMKLIESLREKARWDWDAGLTHTMVPCKQVDALCDALREAIEQADADHGCDCSDAHVRRAGHRTTCWKFDLLAASRIRTEGSTTT